MTKMELSKIIGVSRPTIDEMITNNKTALIMKFILSFESWELMDRIERSKIKGQLCNKQ
ncbi:MAG: hypothetical protein JJV88_04800 [Sulfurovum sp.]|nr:hypothetical protein [Sulfurovaceae bacterium]